MKAGYKPYHPKWHRRRMPIFWWLGKYTYTRFIARELTSLAVAYAAIVLLLEVWLLSRGEEAYTRFQELLQAPAVLAFHTLVLVVLLFHSVTWLGLAPRALVLRVKGRRIPDSAVAGAHYLAWIAASALVAWFLLGAAS